MHRAVATPQTVEHGVTLRDAFWVWVKVALLSFGGPAGQIAVMHRILVEEKRWVSENRFLHALNYCMLLPGPEAQQLSIYIGWLLHRTLGGLIAGILFVAPGFISILTLSILYAGFRDITLVEGVFFGLQAAVLAVVVEAVIRIGRRALKNAVMVGIAALAFVSIFFFTAPFPLIVVTAGLIGYIGGKLWEDKFHVIRGHQTEADDGTVITDAIAQSVRPSTVATLRTAGICLVLWLGPVAVLAATLGFGNIYVTEAIFFSQAAVVTFGGAYAVLAFIAQRAVETYGWLQPGEMLHGLGMAETTPGPLIQVVQFVGFMGAYREPGTLDPMVAGILGSIVVTWVTFVPCFLWIFTGAPFIEHLRGNKSLNTALSGITAAVVGVVLNLAVWFFVHSAFATVDETHVAGIRILMPEWATADFVTIAIAVSAFVAIFRFRVNMIVVIAGAVVVGVVYYLLLAV